MDEILSRPWTHLVVLNPDSLDWLSRALTTKLYYPRMLHCSKMVRMLNCLWLFLIIVFMGQAKWMALEGLMGKKMMILATIIGTSPTKLWIETLIKNMIKVSTLVVLTYQEQVEILQIYLLPNHLRCNIFYEVEVSGSLVVSEIYRENQIKWTSFVENKGFRLICWWGRVVSIF